MLIHLRPEDVTPTKLDIVLLLLTVPPQTVRPKPPFLLSAQRMLSQRHRCGPLWVTMG